MHSMFSEKGLIYQKLFIDNKCALNTLLLLVWWRKVYIGSLGRQTPRVCLLQFSLGSSHYKPCIAGFLHFCSKDKCGKQNQLYRHHFVSLAVRIRNNFVAMKRFRVLIEKKKLFFFKAKAGIKEILAEMSNSAVSWIHTVWTEDDIQNFRLNIFLGHAFGHSLLIGFAHHTTKDATRPNGLHRSTSWSLILMQKILDFWSSDKTWMERGRRKILW